MDIIERMFELIDEMYKEQKDFAEVIGVKPQRVSEWRLRKSHSYVKRLEKISKALDTTPEYLLTGEGPRHKSKAVSNSDTANEDQLMAAFFEGGEDLSQEEMEELWADARDYIQYKLAQRRKKQDGQ